MLMRGYLDAEDNASAYDPQGFFRTGDLIGYDPKIAGYRLVGRSKCLMVLSTGKKLSPEPIEAIINDLPYVQAAVLVGEGRSFASVILFILPSDMQALTSGSKNELASMTQLLHAALKEKLHGISEYEQPKRFLIVPWAPSDRQEFVTPTMKLKRDVVISAMKDAIARLYENDSPPVQVYSS
jgi:long-chain acyl-CoA synthetase